MKVRIEIDTKTFIRFWLVVIGFGLAGLAIWRAKDALILIIISAFLTMALNAPVSKIAKILPGSKKNRVGATAVAYLILVLILAAFGAFVVPVIVEQTAKFISNLPEFVVQITAENSVVRKVIEQNHLESFVNEIYSNLSQFATTFAKNIGGIFFGGINTLINAIFSILMILTMTFLMLVEGPSWLNKIWKMYEDKEKEKHHRRVAHKMYRAVANYVNGQMTISAISGVLGASVTAILSLTMGVPLSLAVPVGVILFILGMIPMFGAMTAGILSALIIGFNVWSAGVIFLIYFLIYIQIENNVISPIIQAKNNQLSALIIIVAITVGIYVLGILGAIVSIPIAACVKILLEEFFLKNRREQKKIENISLEQIIEK